ncbi:capsular exopolysaccharide biosynthesis protein [Aequorivita sublithincola DSM 14238]|uniref:non-specific protein-tyrosine kinase n=1 Tax=Aequorivita sublithincola (strain DSM 14238 / LMG 21431 / ACAM 643 / 9-3) TaxID=746697 RepID=I3YZC7_AEQSU|nr:polysaccharide biosynthesis tyrosine autokinase [Aequorivita sublithincola]AFL82345.1 capsular exopolysaccharide biosynthesis protein [Aequorivita sublithincola DSM 14238]
MQDLPQNEIEEQELTLREQLESYLRYWPWFVASVLVMLVGAYIYLRYTVPLYQVKATILIKDEKSNELSELAAFQDLGMSFSTSELNNELEILRSKTLTERVVDNLNLVVRYYKVGNIRDAEVFDNRPFDLKVIPNAGKKGTPNGFFYIAPISTTQYTLKSEGQRGETYAFGKPINFPWGTIVVSPNLAVLNENLENTELRVLIQNRDAVVGSLRSGITASQVSNGSSVILLQLVSPVPEKARAILNELIQQYNEDAINDRNMVSRNTANFIQSRLEIITGELDSVETGKVEFKEENRLTDITAEGQMFLQDASTFNKLQLEVETQIALVNTMEEYLKNGNTADLLPANLGVEKEGFTSQVANYNQLILERNKLMQSSTAKNPLVIGLDKQIGEMRQNIRASLSNVKNGLQIQRGRLRGQEARIGGEISAIPRKEKQFRSISRQQEIKEALYLYLLQKREETAISLAVTTPKAKVVDSAYSQGGPVSPKRQIILLAALILGLILPFLVIYIKQLLDNKIRNRAYVERKGGSIPIVGEIPELSKKDEELIKENDYSVLAESFRILRTNLQYLVLNKQEKTANGKAIFVTSTVKGEGKTFVSANLAITLANSGAKVILVGADIRNPQLQRYIDGSFENKGVVEYLVYKDTDIHNYLQPSKTIKNLWLMVSGTIPPNPAELWMQDRAGELFAELVKDFDYVVVDTAPSMLVTDTLLINQYADITLYTLRAGYTEKKLLGFPLENERNKKLKNVAFVLNNVSMANFGYGNKYGYTYGQQKVSFWQKIFNR